MASGRSWFYLTLDRSEHHSPVGIIKVNAVIEPVASGEIEIRKTTDAPMFVEKTSMDDRSIEMENTDDVQIVTMSDGDTVVIETDKVKEVIKSVAEVTYVL